MSLHKLLDRLIDSCIELGIEHRWQQKISKWARLGGEQSLLTHALNTASVARKIAFMWSQKTNGLSNEEILCLITAAFLHDFPKEDQEYQNAVDRHIRQGVYDPIFDHTVFTKEQVNLVTKKFIKPIHTICKLDRIIDLEEFIDGVLSALPAEDPKTILDVIERKQNLPAPSRVRKLVSFADALCSKADPTEATKLSRDVDWPKELNLQLTYHKLSVIRGILTTFLNEALIEIYNEAGWEPTLYFPNGVIYATMKPNASLLDINTETIFEKIATNYRSFINNPAFKLQKAKASMGSLTGRAILFPDWLLMDSSLIDSLLSTAFAQRAMAKSPRDGEKELKKRKDSKKKKTEYDQIVEMLTPITDDLPSVYSKALSDYNALIFVAGILEEFAKPLIAQNTLMKFQEELYQQLIQMFGENVSASDLLNIEKNSVSKAVTNTVPHPKRIELMLRIWGTNTPNDLLGRSDRQQELRNRLQTLLEYLWNAFNKDFLDIYDILKENLSDLVKDIAYPYVHLETENPIQLAQKLEGEYSSPKRDAKEIQCFLCNNSASEVAIASLIGEGSEKFTNFLAAGKPIRGDYKAKICPLCVEEAKLRNIFFSRPPEEVFVLAPERMMSPEAHELWSREVNTLLFQISLGIDIMSSWTLGGILKGLIQGKIPPHIEAKWLIKHLRISKKQLKALADGLNAFYDNPSEIPAKNLDRALKNFESFEEAAKAYLSEEIELGIEDKIKLQEIQRKFDKQIHLHYTTPGLLLIFRPYKLGERDETSVCRMIRQLFVSLLLSELFIAKVTILPNFSPINKVTSRGCSEIPSIPLRHVIHAWFSIDRDYISILDRLDLLKRTSSVLALYEFIRSDSRLKPTNNELVELATMIRGKLLRKITEKIRSATKKQLPPAKEKRLFELLSPLQDWSPASLRS